MNRLKLSKVVLFLKSINLQRKNPPNLLYKGEFLTTLHLARHPVGAPSEGRGDFWNPVILSALGFLRALRVVGGAKSLVWIDFMWIV